ncbi:Dabb family protein [Fusibacter paucivorans]|uniref:Dabb family protein n=1 Tax=Fusibacter paucivorans TaxID=76009 RepID=A0ABS5PL54_9FIRM|nr:Dabb family protein [Fusibacter paucivorans]MBS7525909.1 Dabb family protein [Fusibacter paucivorans]
MIKHVVMWRLKASHDKMANALKIKTDLEALAGEIEGLISIEAGVTALPDPQAYDVVLIAVFEDQTAFERYKTHPKHVVAAEFIGSVKEARTAVDYLLP